MNRITNLLMFVAGAAVGSVITWKFTEEKYKRIAQEEIDSVKEVFSKREEKREDEEDEDFAKAVDLVEYANILNQQGYAKNKEEGDAETVDEPEIISPEEFDENDYDTTTYTYYAADKVLADEVDDIVEDVENTVGYKALDSFGEYVDDAVYVRNHRMRMDYEILLDNRSYYKDVKRVPHPAVE